MFMSSCIIGCQWRVCWQQRSSSSWGGAATAPAVVFSAQQRDYTIAPTPQLHHVNSLVEPMLALRQPPVFGINHREQAAATPTEPLKPSRPTPLLFSIHKEAILLPHQCPLNVKSFQFASSNPLHNHSNQGPEAPLYHISQLGQRAPRSIEATFIHILQSKYIQLMEIS
ncbi:hypothetical protein EJ08DRAFT_92997 [Tothia fuscella]|uniref:Uncharacterized protein n=1 Tax=Tothia fuscella TaxID=1048955 RepID=A0A9P4NVP3_9PEZI|nr:hypothetical protein EJ08DRAFT_92997 [Tothia fuscella]